MKATREQIIAEANRRWDAELWPRHKSVIDHVIDIMCENWTPPEPVVDPDVLAFREWIVASERTSPSHRVLLDRGHYDNGPDANAYLAGARMAREQEQERAKVLVEYVEALVNGFFLYADYREQAQSTLAKYRGEA